MKRIVLALFILCVAAPSAFALQDAGVVMVDAGSAAPSAQIDDPIEAPRAAFDDLKAARKTSWPLAVLAGLIMLARLAGKAQKVKALAWLGRGKAAFATAGVLAVATAAFDVLALGGSWVSVMTAAAAAGFAMLVPEPKPQ